MTTDIWADAACTQPGVDPDDFFADDHTQALAICARCPLATKAACLEAGKGQEWGVWGGVAKTFTDRNAPRPSRAMVTSAA